MSVATLDPQLQQLKERFSAATKSKDRAALEAILHTNYTLTSPEGHVLTKRQVIENLLQPGTNFMDGKFTRTERKVGVSPDGNTVSEVADVQFEGDLTGENRTGCYVNTATYVKGPDGWVILGTTITKRQNGELPGNGA